VGDARRPQGGPPYIPRAERGGKSHGEAPAWKALQLLAGSAILPENGVLVLEHAAGLALPEEAGRLRLTTTRKYGSTSVSFFRSA
jgi:16S rRNA G966 N2-methylase RsmD